MFRLLALIGLGWLAYRILQERAIRARRAPVALIPSPARMHRQAAAAKLRSAAEGR